MTNLQTLENEIRKALPELMELKSGCLLQTLISKSIYKVLYLIDNNVASCSKDREYNYNIRITDVEIIGKEIQLIHVLKFVYNSRYFKDAKIGDDDKLILQIVSNWNLNKNLLKNQSKELIDFLFNLIQK